MMKLPYPAYGVRLLRPGILVLLTFFIGSLTSGNPSLSQHPKDVTVVPEQTGVFKISASGSGAINFQWYRNGTAVEGNNTPILYADPAEPSDDGDQYYVDVTDSNGTTRSATGTLFVSAYTSDMEMGRPEISVAAIHVDAVNGNDSSGNGSAGAPYKTFNKLRPLLRGGEVVVFHAGSYGEIRFDKTQGVPSAEYSDWVTLMAAPGEDVVADSAFLRGNWTTNRVLWNGNFDLKVRIIGFHITGGVSISEANLVRIEECLLNLPGPWIGSVANVDRATVGIRGARSITVEDCEITDTAIGLGMRGNDLTVLRNHIHHISHDGIRLTGCDVVRIDNNLIYNSDDGYDDSVDWARHSDGMHFFKENDGSTAPIDHNNNIYVRGNKVYHNEAMGWMAQGTHPARNWVVENNIFGPSGSFMLHLKLAVDGFIFRHNTIIVDPKGSYQGLYREIEVKNFAIALPCFQSSSGVEIYNNILAHPYEWHEYNLTAQYCDVFTNNYYYQNAGSIELGENPKGDRYPPFLEVGYGAYIRAGSSAIGGGTAYNPASVDIYGMPRNNPPTIGAVEFVDDSEDPSVPANLTAKPGVTSVQLEWDDSTDNVMVVGYNIYRNGTKAGTSDTNAYLDAGLKPNTSYSYMVSAYDSVGNESEGSMSVGVDTLAADYSWAGFPEDSGYVDTGLWIGILYTPNKPWLYVDLLDKYIYALDPGPEPGGAWGYFIR